MKRTLFVLVFMGSGCMFLAGCLGTQTAANTLALDRCSQIAVKQSNSAEVLSVLQPQDDELISQNQSVVALWPSEENPSVLWFNAVAFDEEYLTAARIYCFTASSSKLSLNIEAVLPADVVDEPYANENAKRIAILKHALAIFGNDMMDVASDSQSLESAVLMAKQAIKTILIMPPPT